MGSRLRADHSDLPSNADGNPPDAVPDIIGPITDAWMTQHLAGRGGDYAPALDLPYRASWSGTRCDRALHYQITGTPETNPAALADIFRMNLGHVVGDLIAAELVKAGWEPEATVDLRPAGIEGSAHADFMNDTTVLELKTVNGTTFKRTATGSSPSGPSFGHVLQGAMAAVAANRPRMTIIYVATELVSKGKQSIGHLSEIGRFAAQWTFRTDDLRGMVEFEAGRIRRALLQAEAGVLPAPALADPEYPAGAVVMDPLASSFGGRWEVRSQGVVQSSGSTWMCAYCRFRDACVEDGE